MINQVCRSPGVNHQDLINVRHNHPVIKIEKSGGKVPQHPPPAPVEFKHPSVARQIHDICIFGNCLMFRVISVTEDIKVLGTNLLAIVIVSTLQDEEIFVDHCYDAKRFLVTVHRNVPCL
ncbi:MAG: hypothetical protein HRU33_14200 [Rhodobacteraceae bacterium]|nr:hypothetical protein [Paracoccaceae bacterium]